MLSARFVPVKAAPAQHRLVSLPLVFREIVGCFVDFRTKAFDHTVDGKVLSRQRRQPADVAEHRAGGIELDEFAVGGLDRGSERGKPLQAAGQQDRHDPDHDAEAEQQLVADAPAEGHAPTSLSAPHMAELARRPNPSGSRTERAELYQKHSYNWRAFFSQPGLRPLPGRMRSRRFGPHSVAPAAIAKITATAKGEFPMSTATHLAKMKCQPCEGGIPALTADEIKKLHPGIAQWLVSADGKSLRREWRVKDFPTALDFFRRVGDVAEAEGHHPDLHLTGYRNVAIELSTHAVGGLTENDFILAAKIDQLPVELKK